MNQRATVFFHQYDDLKQLLLKAQQIVQDDVWPNWTLCYFYFSVLNSIGCRNKKRKKSVTLGSPTTSRVSAQNTDTTVLKNDNVELGEAGRKTPAADLPKQQRPSTSYSIVQLVREEDENQETWKEIARALDRIFFWLFLTLFVVSSIFVYSQAGRLKSLDSFDD